MQHLDLSNISDREALALLHQSVAEARRLTLRSVQMIIDTEEALKLASKMQNPLLAEPRVPRGGARSR
jgi:hypothetical protein